MNEPKCIHNNGPECLQCKALDIPEVEELEQALRARIAELEAEREKLRFDLAATLTHFDEVVKERDAAKAEAEGWQEAVYVKDKQLTEFMDWEDRFLRDLDAARAGEARAVEALKRIEQQLEWVIDNGDTYQASALIEFVSRIRDNYFSISAQPALAWLAQVKREAAEGAWRSAITLAYGCHDYGGGHTGEKYEAFHHGIDTVIRVLEAKRDGDESLQMKVIEQVGAAALLPKEGMDE
jgi:hypothetical protein